MRVTSELLFTTTSRNPGSWWVKPKAVRVRAHAARPLGRDLADGRFRRPFFVEEILGPVAAHLALEQRQPCGIRLHTGDGDLVRPPPALEPVAIYFVLHGQLEGNILAPLVYRRTVHVNPLITLLAILFLAEFMGIAGAVLAVPVAAAAQIVMREALALRRIGGGQGGPGVPLGQ